MQRQAGLLAITAILSFGNLSSAAEPTPSINPVLPRPEVVEGEVLRFEGNYYVVKDLNGKNVRLYIDRATKVDANLSPGDKIVARTATVPVDAAPYATSVAKLGTTRTVDGAILMIEGDYFVIKDANGKEVRVYVDSATKKDSSIKVGDRIVAQIAEIPDAYASAITKR